MKFARKTAVEDGLGEGDARGELAGWRGWPLQNFFGGQMGKWAKGQGGQAAEEGARKRGGNRDAV